MSKANTHARCAPRSPLARSQAVATRTRCAPPGHRCGAQRHTRQQGLSLLETCAALSISGILAVTFVPTFLRELRFSKLAEASQLLDDLYRSSAAYYAVDHVIDGVAQRGCVPSSAGPTPSAPSAQRVWTDFAANNVDGHATWSALGLVTPTGVRYAYEANFAITGCAPHPSPSRPAAVFRAHGDLDGDGVFSTLTREAVLSSDQSSLIPNGPLHVEQRVE